MRAIFTRKEFALGLACALAFGVLCETANAQVRADEMQPGRVFAEVSGSRIAN